MVLTFPIPVFLCIFQRIATLSPSDQNALLCQIFQYPLDLTAAVIHVEGSFADVGNGVVGAAPAQIGKQRLLCCEDFSAAGTRLPQEKLTGEMRQ